MAKAITAPELKGLVLAGGDSLRMGRDKAALMHEQDTLLNRAVKVLRAVLPEVFVSARAEQRQLAGRGSFAVIEDSLGIRGPAAGILSAHCFDPGAAWLVLACDLPLIGSDLLAELVAARDSSRAATAWLSEAGEQAEPLCAVYEPATLAAFLQAVQAGANPSPQQWLAGQPVKLLQRPAGRVLAGANTPAELAELQNDLNSQQAERKQDE